MRALASSTTSLLNPNLEQPVPAPAAAYAPFMRGPCVTTRGNRGWPFVARARRGIGPSSVRHLGRGVAMQHAVRGAALCENSAVDPRGRKVGGAADLRVFATDATRAQHAPPRRTDVPPATASRLMPAPRLPCYCGCARVATQLFISRDAFNICTGA